MSMGHEALSCYGAQHVCVTIAGVKGKHAHSLPRHEQLMDSTFINRCDHG